MTRDEDEDGCPPDGRRPGVAPPTAAPRARQARVRQPADGFWSGPRSRPGRARTPAEGRDRAACRGLLPSDSRLPVSGGRGPICHVGGGRPVQDPAARSKLITRGAPRTPPAPRSRSLDSRRRRLRRRHDWGEPAARRPRSCAIRAVGPSPSFLGPRDLVFVLFREPATVRSGTLRQRAVRRLVPQHVANRSVGSRFQQFTQNRLRSETAASPKREGEARRLGRGLPPRANSATRGVCRRERLRGSPRRSCMRGRSRCRRSRWPPARGRCAFGLLSTSSMKANAHLEDGATPARVVAILPPLPEDADTVEQQGAPTGAAAARLASTARTRASSTCSRPAEPGPDR